MCVSLLGPVCSVHVFLWVWYQIRVPGKTFNEFDDGDDDDDDDDDDDEELLLWYGWLMKGI